MAPADNLSALPEGLPCAGDVIADKYELEGVIGVGGMGAVYAARDLVLGRKVAIKFLLPEAVGSPDARARFLREAKAASAIRNEHVATVFETGSAPPNLLYLVMEHLPGADLAAIVRRPGSLPVQEAVDYMLQAAEAIAEAHAAGIIHRDIKPSNLFVTERADGSPLVKVLDFGISKAISDQTSLTQTAVMMGSPRYMSPEQLRDVKHVDCRSDIWSMGVVLYELLCKRPPFLGATITAVAIAIASEKPPPIRTLREGVPAELEAVILRALEKSPERRFATVAEFASALLPFVPERTGKFSFDRLPPPSSATGRNAPGNVVREDETESSTRALASTHVAGPTRGRRYALFVFGTAAGLFSVAVFQLRGPATTEPPRIAQAPPEVADAVASPATSEGVAPAQSASTAPPAASQPAPASSPSAARATRSIAPAPPRKPPARPSRIERPAAASPSAVAVPPTGEPPGRDRL